MTSKQAQGAGDIVTMLRKGEKEGVDGWWGTMAEAADEIERLRDALHPFAQAYRTVTANAAVTKTCSLGQIARLCDCEISGVHYQLAAATLTPEAT
jgi:hypothetical protein